MSKSNFWKVCLVPEGRPLVIRDEPQARVGESAIVPKCRNSVSAFKWARDYQRKGISVCIVPPTIYRLPLP